jgi:hypothetical protein
MYELELPGGGGLIGGALHLEELQLRRARAEAETAELRVARAKEAEQVRVRLLDIDAVRRRYMWVTGLVSAAGMVLLCYSANLNARDPWFMPMLWLSLGLFMAALVPGFTWFAASGRCARLRTHLSSLREGGG